MGFTLTELLVGLGVVGLIASLTVPKILISIEKSSRNNIFKGTISALSDVLNNQGNLELDAWNNRTEYWESVRTSLTGTIVSQYTALPNLPCNPSTNCHGWPFVFRQKNGSIIGLSTSGVTQASCFVHAVIDANGVAPPNKVGEDRLQVSLDPQTGNLVDSNKYGLYPPEVRTPNKLLFDSLR